MIQGYFFLIVCAIFISARIHAHAQEDESLARPSSVNLTVTGDNAGGQGAEISAELIATENIRWNIGVGNSSIKNEATATAKKTTQNFLAGVDYHWNEYFETGIQISNWGLRDELVHRALYIPLSVTYQDFDFLLRPGAGEVEFETSTLRTREFLFEDSSFLISAGYTFIKYLHIGLAHETHNYEHKNGVEFSSLSSDLAAVFFSEATLSLALSILKERNSLEVSYAFESFDLGFATGRIESAFDGSYSRYAEVFSSFAVTKNWLLSGALGRTSEPVRYLELAVTYYF